jgi:hypothetical protein
MCIHAWMYECIHEVQLAGIIIGVDAVRIVCWWAQRTWRPKQIHIVYFQAITDSSHACTWLCPFAPTRYAISLGKSRRQKHSLFTHMCMCSRMCVCIHACVYVFHACVYVFQACVYIFHAYVYVFHAYVYVFHACMYVFHACVYVFHACVYVITHMCMYLCMCVRIHAYVYEWIQAHTAIVGCITLEEIKLVITRNMEQLGPLCSLQESTCLHTDMSAHMKWDIQAYIPSHMPTSSRNWISWGLASQPPKPSACPISYSKSCMQPCNPGAHVRVCVTLCGYARVCMSLYVGQTKSFFD